MLAAYGIDALQLAARPGGVTCPALRARMQSKTISTGRLLLRLLEKGWLQRTGMRRGYVYTITPAGVALLELEQARIKGQHRLPAPQASKSVQRGTWGKAPAQGSPVQQVHPRVHRVDPVPISAGYDSRFQVDPTKFEGGEFMAEWRRLRGQA